MAAKNTRFFFRHLIARDVRSDLRASLYSLSGFDLEADEPEWRIAPERNKMRELHIIPLPTQAIAILRNLHALTGRGRLVFPSSEAGSPRTLGVTSRRSLLFLNIGSS